MVTEAQVGELEARQVALYEQALTAAKEAAKRPAAPAVPAKPADDAAGVLPTGVARATLARIGQVLTSVPTGFHLNPKMVQQLARRAKMAEGAAPLDWGTAEALAFGTLLLEGTPIRIVLRARRKKIKPAQGRRDER